MFSLLNAEVARSIQADRLREAERNRRAHQALAERRSGRRTAAEADDGVAAAALPMAWVPPVAELARLAPSANVVKAGPLLEVGATAATAPDGSIMYPGDPYLQTRGALLAIAGSLKEFGVGLEDVVRTRVFLKKTWQWEEAGRAHGEVFGDTKPVTTFVGAGGFVDSNMLVAVEATALANANARR